MDLLRLALEAIPLGIAAAVTPMLAALQILIVSQDTWKLRALAVALGGATAFLGFGFLVLAGFSQLPVNPSVENSPAGYAIRLAIGVGLLLGSVWLLRPHPEMQQRMEVRVSHYVTDARIWIFFVLAFALSIKDISSFAVLLPALHDIATSPANIVGRSLVFVLLYSLALLPVLAPILLRAIFGHRVVPNLKRLYRFTVDHQFKIVGVMCILIGSWLTISGLIGLF